MFLTVLGIGNAWGAAVASKAPADGKHFIIAMYEASSDKYYALYHIDETGGLYCGEECTLNGSNQVTAIADETSPTDCLWFFESTGTDNEYYISFDNSGTKMYLYKNGTNGDNYKITATDDYKSNSKWLFKSGTANGVTTYSVKTTKSGATKHTVLRGETDEDCSFFCVEGTDDAFEITLLEIVPRTVTFNAQGGSFDDPSIFVNTNQITEASGGAGITLPLANPSASCISDGWAFYGWATAPCSSSTTTAPAIVGQAGDTYYPVNNSTTLHAVYAKGEYTKITSTDDLNETDKYFFAAIYSTKNYIMTDYFESNKLAAKQIDETSTGKYHAGQIVPSWCFTLEEGSSSWYIVDCNNSNTNHYLDTYYSAWYGHLKDDAFTFTYSTDHWVVQNVYSSGDRYFGFFNSDNTFNKTSSSTELLIYKVTSTPYYYSNPSCCAYEVSYSESGSSHLAAVDGMTFSSSSIATCGDEASRTITITVTPASGYTLFGDTKPVFTKTSGTVAATIGDVTDNGNGTFSYECTFASNNDGAGTFAISPGQFTNYRTQCCTKLGDIDGTVTLTQGGNSVKLTAWSAVSNASSYTVKMYKKNGGGTWDLVSGTAANGDAGTAGTRTGITDRSTGVTFTGLVVESEYKFTVQAVAGSSAYCDGAETAVTEINDIDVSSSPFKFRYAIYIDDGTNDNYDYYYIEPTGNTDEGSVDIDLTAHITSYQFKIAGGFSGWWGQTGTSNIPASTKWTLNGSNNVKLNTGAGGTYTFTVDYSGTTNPAVTVTFPSADQDAGYVIYYDNSVLNWSNLYYRVGNNSSCSKVDVSLVPGTDKFYKVTTPDFDNMDAWHIANNYGWTGSNSIYRTKTSSDPAESPKAITNSISFQQYAVTEDITVIPTSTHSTGGDTGDGGNSNCEFYTINTPTSGMLTHNAEISSYSHGTVTVSYTNTSGSASSFTSGDEDLAHRCVLTITATPATGYSLSSLQVNSSNFTSGNEHILAADATITAVFSAQTSTVTLKPNEGSGSDQEVLATYDADMPLVTTADKTPAISVPSRDHYSFTGYFDNTSGGTQYYTYTSSTLASARTWDKTGAQNLYAQWLGDLYTITYKDKGDVSFSGEHVDGYPTNHRYGTATTLKSATKTGYTFDGWFDESTCSGDALATVGASAYTDNFTLYGSWTPKTTTITLNMQSGSSGTEEVTATYDANTNLTSAIIKPTRSNYVFKGYYSATSGGGVQVIDADGNWIASVSGYTGTGKIWKNENAEVTLYAYWAPCYAVTWYVNGVALSGDDLGSAPTSVETGKKPGYVPPTPADNTLNNCANKFMGWSTKSAGSTQKTTSYYDDLFTDVAGSPTIEDDIDFYAVFAERDGVADVDDVLWSEDWTGATYSNGSTGMDDAKPSAQGNHSGKAVYGGASITYAETTNGTYVRNESNAGGSAPELMIKAAEVWTISGIPSGGAATLTVSYKQNGQSLTVEANGTSYSGSKTSSSSGTQSFDVTVGSTSTFSLTFTAGNSKNVRVDNIEVKVKTVSYSNYVTECAANQVRVTYNFDGGSGDACTEGVTTKSASYSICSTEPTKTGYDFEGWSDGTNTYDAGATYNLLATTEFTASWEANEYTITYKDEGDVAYSGTNSGSLVGTHTYGTPTDLVDGDKGTNYRFDGWFTESTCSGDPITSIAADAITEDITLYAKWTRVHAITWTVNKVPDVTYVEDGSALTFPDDPDAPTACSATKEFVGWITSEIEDETDDEPAFISAGGTVNTAATYHAVFAHPLGTAISATEDDSFSSKSVDKDTYCGVNNKFTTSSHYVQKQSIWNSSQMTNVKVRIKVYHISNSTADVLRVSLINSSGAEVVGRDLTTSCFGSAAGSAGYSAYIELTPTTAVTGYKVSLKTKNSNGVSVGKVTREVVSKYEAYATYCCATKIDAPDVTATKRATAADASTVTLSWDAVTDATGYKVRWGVDGEWEDNGTSCTYVKAGLAPDTYTWYVKAKYDEDDYCGAEIDKGSTTVNTAYEVTYDANTTGYTGDEPDGGFYESGETVTISATELSKSRYHFDGWTPYNTSTSAAISVTTGTFTMPAADVLIQGGWTEVLSGDEVYITSAKDITTMSSMDIMVERTTYKSGTMTISNQTGGQGGTFHAVIDGATADASDGLMATVKIEYTPSKANVTESATMTAVVGSESYDFTVYGRSLPEDFVIVAKVGAVWTALPADATSAGLQQGYSPTLDNTTTPTKATLAPAAAVFNYYAKSSKTTDYIRLAGKDNSKALWGNATNGIKMNAAIGGGYATGDPYEWKLATTDNATYTLYNDNSSRYLGVNSDKKWGTHASATTTTLRFLPVDATATNIGMTVTSWGENSFTFTTSDDIPAYDHVAVECNGDTYSAWMTGSGPYTITIYSMDFSDYSGASLVVQWISNEDVVLAQGAVLMPIFITEDNTDFEGYDQDILSTTDVHIIDGSMLTITTNGLSVHNLSIEGGSTLNISKTAGDAAVTFSVNSLYLRGGLNSSCTEYDMPRVYIDPKSTLTKSVNTVNFDISVDQRHYYPFAIPFRVKVSDINYANSTLAYYAQYGTTGQYVIKEYDGARRAEVGPDQQNNWKVVPKTDPESGDDVYLEPGRGYILTAVSLPSYGGGVIRIPLSFTNAWTAKGEQGTIDKSYYKNVVTVTAYEGSATVDNKGQEKKSNKGWNLLGVPFMSCYATSGGMYSEEGSAAIIQGKYNFETGGWTEETIRYVNVPTHDFSEYIQADLEDDDPVTVLLPGWCFFVQIDENGDLTFLTEAQAEESDLPIYAPKREQETMPTVKTGIILSDGEKSDKTTFLISDKYSASEYEINADLEKMFGSGYTLATYSLSGATRLAYNALSNTDASNVIPIGYRAPANGEYTFSINPRYAEDEALEHINLIDYETGIVTDLLQYSYTFSTDSTQNDSRFALNVTKRQDTTTDIENGANDTNHVRKLIINDKVYIIRGGLMYDATGKRVWEIDK